MTTSTAHELRSGKSENDENFPVASFLVAKRHRAPILAFYRFARAADDVADHPTLAPSDKLSVLDRLEATLLGRGDAEPDALPLRAALDAHRLNPQHALDLLAAFRQDVTKKRYATWAELIDYCRYSAAPVGRFVLDVHGESEASWPANDALCTVLQILNHLQDCGKDYAQIDRVYLPLETLAAHGARVSDLAAPTATTALRGALLALTGQTKALIPQAQAFSGQIRDWRLGLEVAVITRLAQAITKRLLSHDPLSERVHLNKAEMLGAAAAATAIETLARITRQPLPTRPVGESRT